MNEPFDPFGFDDEVAAPTSSAAAEHALKQTHKKNAHGTSNDNINTSTATDITLNTSGTSSIGNDNSQTSFFDFESQFDTPFDTSFQGHSSVNLTNQSMNTSVDSDIFSALFVDASSSRANNSTKHNTAISSTPTSKLDRGSKSSEISPTAPKKNSNKSRNKISSSFSSPRSSTTLAVNTSPSSVANRAKPKDRKIYSSSAKIHGKNVDTSGVRSQTNSNPSNVQNKSSFPTNAASPPAHDDDNNTNNFSPSLINDELLTSNEKTGDDNGTSSLPFADDQDMAQSTKVGTSSSSSPNISSKAVITHPASKQQLMQLPVYLKLHETMSCVYDNTKTHPQFEIEGTINLMPNKFIQGQSFFISLKDPLNHVGEVTTYMDCARELTITRPDSDNFAKQQLKDKCRIFQVDIPMNLTHLDAKPIQVLKFKGSEFLRPIPLLVNCKVRVAGNYCRVSIKVRANPSNKKNIQNVAILMAVPPDVSGETMKMSLRGGVWDPMRRIIIWSSPFMKSGETIEFQLQFEYTGNNPSISHIPVFPILVRCDALDDQLSDIDIQIGGETYYDANGVGHRQVGTSPFKMNLSSSYRLFHRKI